MRKLCSCLVLLALTAFAGASAPRADAASCTYKCSCSGTPLKCCTTNGQEVCKPTADILCPQVYTC